MPVVRTAVKNQPSKRPSLAWTARKHWSKSLLIWLCTRPSWCTDRLSSGGFSTPTSAAGRGVLADGDTAAGAAGGGHATEGLAVREHRVDLPALAGRPGDPDLVLGREAAGLPDLLGREQALARQPRDLAVDLRRRRHLDTEVVDRAAAPRVLDEDQLERWLGDGEVGVPRLHLVRLGVEQLAVEGDRP